MVESLELWDGATISELHIGPGDSPLGIVAIDISPREKEAEKTLIGPSATFITKAALTISR